MQQNRCSRFSSNAGFPVFSAVTQGLHITYQTQRLAGTQSADKEDMTTVSPVSTDSQLSDKELAWQRLGAKFEQIKNLRISDLFDRDPGRFTDFSLQACGILLDYSKNRLDNETRSLLIELARQSGMKPAIEQLFAGEPVNNTEQRPALHTALRGNHAALDHEQRQALIETDERVSSLVDQLQQGKWLGSTGRPVTDVVNIGIGGSDLGPVMVTMALTPYHQDRVKVHFVSNVDGRHIALKLKQLDPETTLFIVSSKSFSTLETLKNAEAAREWCRQAGIEGAGLAQHFVGVTTNISAATEFGIAEKNIFPLWDWVGGRYSLWSATGLPIAIAVGNDDFRALREGAGTMDQHFREAPLEQNMPVILGMLSIWYINFFKTQAQIVIPYDHYLHKLPAYLQQLEMESNGKSVRRDGSPVTYETMGAIFGEAGSNTQHSFHQLLHQGSFMFPVDFIAEKESHYKIGEQHRFLLANCFAQSRALMMGQSLEAIKAGLHASGLPPERVEALAPHKVIPGNKPSNTLLMEKLTPETLGALIALYEHKVYVQSVVWDINPFDQWGVELGKEMSGTIAPALAGAPVDDLDPSTAGLIELVREPK